MRRTWWLLPAALFLATRIVDALLMVAASGDQVATVPSADFPQAHATPADPGYLTMVTNWDGQWYRVVVEHGYPAELPLDGAGQVGNNTWAFFPVYPAVVKVVMEVTGLSFGLVASALSALFGAVAMALLWRLVERAGGSWGATMTVVGVCAFPAAPILQVAYSEALALLLVMLCLGWLRDRRYAWLYVGCLVLALTRPIALALALVLAWHWWMRWRSRESDPFPVRQRWTVGLLVVWAAALIALWPAVAAVATGDASAYFETQASWHNKGDEGVAPSLATVLLQGNPGALVVIVLIVGVLGLVVLRRGGRVWGPELRAWAMSFAVGGLVAIAPATWAILRYSLPISIGFWPWADRGSGWPRTLKVALVALVCLLGFVGQRWWIDSFWVLGPDNVDHP